MLHTLSEGIRSVDHGGPLPTGDKDKRRLQRISLPLPVRVEVKIDQSASWNEITRLTDVSAFGAGFTLKRPVKRGRLVQMTIPMPRQLRCYDYGEAQYRVWGLIRRCIETTPKPGEPQFSIGVAFCGRNPPEGFLNHPARLYDISHRESGSEALWHVVEADLMADDKELPAELRKQSRFHIPEALILELMDENGEVSASEATVTENISVGGAAVFTQFDADAGTFFRVTSERFNVKIISIVRGRRVGPDGITRLHLEFVDRLFPLEGIS
jgi:hypothetical protein